MLLLKVGRNRQLRSRYFAANFKEKREDKMYPSVYSEQARQAVTIGQKHHCTFRVVGMGTIEKSYYSNQMVYEPTDLVDSTTIPKEALRRVEILKRAGIPIKDYILRHDAPLVLPKPVIPKKPFKLPEIKTDKIVSVGKVMLALTTFAAVGLLQLLGLVAAVAIDPGLIVVLDDEHETQVEVMTWLE